MSYKDYYHIMGLDRTASQEEVKRAYRKLARKYHPDVSKEHEAETKFKELGEAYDILKDPEKRKKYDKYGDYWQQQEQSQRSGQQQQYHQHFDESTTADFEEFINSIFRQRRQQQPYEPFYNQAQDVHAKMTIDLEDSYHGSEKVLQLQIPNNDQNGFINYTQRSIRVKIPKGITNKKQIRLKGQGGMGMGKGQTPGDLYIEVHINPHPIFHFNHKDIHLELPVSPWEAVLGATINVPTLGGKVALKIPKLSQSGKSMRLKGKGLPGNPPGDHYVKLHIVISQKDNHEASKLYEQLSKTIKFNPRAKLGVDND